MWFELRLRKGFGPGRKSEPLRRPPPSQIGSAAPTARPWRLGAVQKKTSSQREWLRMNWLGYSFAPRLVKESETPAGK